MKKLFLGVAATAALAIGSLANAGILIEPYLGYHTGKFEIGSTENDTKGITYGGRIGYQSLGFMGGFDYMTGTWTSESSGSDVDVTPTDMGVFIGYKFPVLIRAYFTYNFDAQTKAESGGSSNKFTGKGMKLGIGYTGFPFVSINLEYISDSYDEMDGMSLSSDATGKMYGLTISAPFDL